MKKQIGENLFQMLQEEIQKIEVFEKVDSQKITELKNKKEWDNEEINDGYFIIERYKKEVEAKKWKEIHDTFINWRKSIRPQIENGWMPISFENDEPVEFAGWIDGIPYIKTLYFSEKKGML